MRTKPAFRGSPLHLFGLALTLLIVALVACTESGGNESGCNRPAQATPRADGNLFVNAGFEDGGDPWFSKEGWGTSFTVSNAQARSGESSVLLQLRSEDAPSEAVRVYGAVQRVCPQEFPEVVRGHYFVERWEQGTPIQYLQFVAIVDNAENIPPGAAPATNHQVRYILAGVDQQPTRISNARYVMVATEQPRIGEWVPFEFNLREDFRELWGDVPSGYDGVEFFFEARWDDRQPEDGVSIADVYYDDLFLGFRGKSN